MRVLVANDPRVYREAIAGVLPTLRPLVEVFLAEPDELEKEAKRVLPHLIVCSGRITTALARTAGLLAWVVLYPDGEDRVEVGDAASGETTLFPEGFVVNDLLSVVDEASRLLSGQPA